MDSSQASLAPQAVRAEWERRCREDELVSRGGLPVPESDLPAALLAEIEDGERWRLSREASLLGRSNLSISQALGQLFLLGDVVCRRLPKERLPQLIAAMRSASEVIARLHVSSIEETAGTDRLTGLPNGRAFDADLDAALSDEPEANVVVVIDLDGLKVANDEFGGHPGGNRYIQRFAADLHSFAIEHDGRAYRWHEGGDEFCVVLPQISKERALSLMADFRSRSDVAPFCFGASLAPQDGLERKVLTDLADEVLNAMKQERTQAERAMEARNWLTEQGWAAS